MTWTDKRARTLGYPKIMVRYYRNGQFIRYVTEQEAKTMRWYAIDAGYIITSGDNWFCINREVIA